MTQAQDNAACAAIVKTIDDARADPSLWPGALNEIAQYLNASFAALIFEDSASALLELKYSPHAAKGWITEFLRHYRKLDPLRARAFADIGVGRAFSSSDLVSSARFQRSAAFHRWMAPHGLLDFLGAVLHRSKNGACLFVAFRDEASGAADEISKTRLNALLPHLARASEEGPASASLGDELLDLFGELAAPVLVVDAGMRILYHNRSAEEMLENHPALNAKNGVMTIVDSRAKEALEAALGASGDGKTSPESLAIMLRSGDERCCVIHVLRLHDGGAALFVRSLALGAVHGGGVVSDLYGLTARERSVLLAIAEIGGVPATAKALGLSEGTVKGYLKSIFQKTGATRQADLVKLVLALETPFRAGAREKLTA